MDTSYKTTLLDILGKVVSDYFDRINYTLPEDINTEILSIQSDFTPESIETSESNHSYIAKPNTGTQTVYITEELEDLYGKFVSAVETGDIAGLLMYGKEILSLLQAEYSTDTDIQSHIYDIVASVFEHLLELILYTEDGDYELDTDRAFNTLHKLILLTGTQELDNILQIIVTILLLYMVMYFEARDNRISSFLAFVEHSKEKFVKSIVDIIEYMSLKYAKMLRKDDKRDTFTLAYKPLEKLLIFAGLVKTELLDSILRTILSDHFPAVTNDLSLLYQYLTGEIDELLLTESTKSVLAEYEVILSDIGRLLNIECFDSTDCFIKALRHVNPELVELIEEQSDTDILGSIASETMLHGIGVHSEHLVTLETRNQGYVTEFVIHEHKAKKAGLHYDLRIRVGQKVMSIAFRKPIIALQKGVKRQGFIQPIHTTRWLSFEGEIKEGYGAGTLKIVAKGEAQIYKTGRGNIIVHFIDELNGKDYWYAFIRTEEDRKNRYHPVLLIPVDSKKESEHLYKPTIREILDYFDYRPGSDLMSVSVDI